jgi:LysM repeat protein
MSPENTTTTPSTKLCPTCGTRLSEDAVRCLVCGAELGSAEKPTQPVKPVQGSRMPSITLSLPAAIGLLALFLVIGAVLVYFALRTTPEVIIDMTSTPTTTLTPTPTVTVTLPPPTPTDTPQPTPTPLTYLVQANDTCLGIAAFFGVSVQSIVTLNNLPAACDTLSINQPLLIPQPTPTSTPLPSATLSLAEQTEAACEKVEYIVQENDTLGGIAANYNVPQEAIREENGLPNDSVYIGQPITIPLCRRFATPGPSPTPTLPPPYPAPNLLLPADGAPFTLADDVVTLQWASVGTLRDNEAYAIYIEDSTAGQGVTLSDYVKDTKYLVSSNLRPTEPKAHAFYWWVVVVRQTGTDESGNAIWENAGAVSGKRVFTWTGAGQSATPTP